MKEELKKINKIKHDLSVACRKETFVASDFKFFARALSLPLSFVMLFKVLNEKFTHVLIVSDKRR